MADVDVAARRIETAKELQKALVLVEGRCSDLRTRLHTLDDLVRQIVVKNLKVGDFTWASDDNTNGDLTQLFDNYATLTAGIRADISGKENERSILTQMLSRVNDI